MLPRRHIPNAITITRLVLTAACIACLSRIDYSRDHYEPWVALGLITFCVAALSDWLDGFLARRWDVISQFGRIMDPLADKVLILGAFILLAGPGFAFPDSKTSLWPHLITFTGVYPWMVVVMLTRELLVTGLRSAMEGAGQSFGAVGLGKVKMFLQSLVIITILAQLTFYPPGFEQSWMRITRDVLLYVTVAVTVLSAWPYVAAAVRASTRHNPEPSEVTPDC
ncbi:MAG: CDP-alcohol phosphatidyltransferase family protein [Planctomycetota bacterium]